jgi:LmbE family N-acetylglucosaminyl deacetylase
MKETGRVLAVFAHPDDESYGPGATLARLAAEGSEVRLITYTRGEAASMGDSPLYSPAFLADTREKELDAACEALGISSHEKLAFPDKGLAGLPEADLLPPALHTMEEFRPHLVMTFHPGGISGHPDHKTISSIARKAIDTLYAGGGGPRLAYYAVPDSVGVKVKWRRLVTTPDDQMTHAVEAGEYLEVKKSAGECHKTQRYLMERLSEFPGGLESVWDFEYFVVDGFSPQGKPLPQLPLEGA